MQSTVRNVGRVPGVVVSMVREGFGDTK